MGRLVLVQSNRTERLAEAFAEAVKAERGARPALEAAFSPISLVVPSRPIEELLRRTVASRLGIAAHLQVESLPAMLARLLREASAETRAIDRSALQGWILTLLHDDELLQREGLAPVRRYLVAAGSEPEAVDRRRLQLTARLVPLFESCALPPRGAGAGPPEASWQRILWDALFAEDGLVARSGRETGIRWIWLAQAFRGTEAIAAPLPPALHLFSLPPWTPLLPRALPTLIAGSDVHVYHLQPCREHEEDFDEEARGQLPKGRFPARGAGAARQLALDEGLDPVGLDAKDPLIARHWGRPARECRRRLLALAPEARVLSAFEAPGGGRDEALLEAAQREILDRGAARRSLRDGARPTADESVSLLACPGLRREVETIAAEIWRLVEGSAGAARPLRFDEIAILVPAASAELYFTHVAAAFREAGDIPHRLVDAAAARGSRIFEATELLLGLPLGAFTRREMMRVLLHPAVLARFSDLRPEDWLELPDRLGVAHGADRDDHQGTYIDADLFNWDQGCRRLALGAFMDGSDEEPVALGGVDALLPARLSAAALPAALSFGLLVRSLLADARFARAARLPLSDWVTFLRAFVAGTLAPSSPEDERALATCLKAVGRLNELPIAGPVSYALAADLARQALAGLTTTRASHPAQGVAVAPLAAGRVLPCRALFVAGLGAGRFPAADADDELDPRLRAARGLEATLAEQDRALFLEALLAARERLVLSYVARNVQTGDRLEPCPVVRDFAALIDGLRPGAAAACTRTPPLHRHEDEAARRVFPATVREARAQRLGEALAAPAGGGGARESIAAAAARGGAPGSFAAPAARGGAPASLAALKPRLPPGAYAALAQALGVVLSLPGPEGAAADARAQALRLSLSGLRRFLECPLQASAARLLGLREGEDEAGALLAEDEPFVTAPLDRARLLRRALLLAARAAAAAGRPIDEATLANAYEASAARERLAGRLPLGPFGEAERRAHRALLSSWAGALSGLLAPGAALEPMLFGGGDEHEALGRVVPALRLSLGAARPLQSDEVELVGRTSPIAHLPDGRSASFVLATSMAEDAAAFDEREALKGYVDALALAAARPAHEAARGHAAYVLRGGAAPYERRFGPFAVEEARAALGELAAELFAGVHGYLLPCEAAFAAQRRPDRAIEEIVAQLRERGTFSSRFGPVPFPERYPTPDEGDARAMIRRRFGRYFAGAEASPAAPEAEPR